ncbi:LysE family translocator [Billgrantia endophytica]|uniref:LysE family translocator n=1 Tax=Billgrantia endophytica TaxID=2033802 RepID=A0A2N7U7Y3_9GAMM|nr:LysE family translocator [Halomonas endophytica]PMR76542.1 LysE family translocator [Halomonas endophytica]
MELWVFVGALAAVYLLPGPDMVLILQTGATRGGAQAFATVAGLATARGLHVVMAAFGLATMFKTAPWTFDAVRFIGAGYLTWLGIQILRSGSSLATNDTRPHPGPKTSRRSAWQRGLLTNLLNPKSLLFCSVLLPHFVVPQQGAILLQFVILGTLVVGTGVLFDTLYALSASRLGKWLTESPVVQRLQRWLFGLLLIGFGGRLAILHGP